MDALAILIEKYSSPDLSMSKINMTELVFLSLFAKEAYNRRFVLRAKARLCAVRSETSPGVDERPGAMK